MTPTVHDETRSRMLAALLEGFDADDEIVDRVIDVMLEEVESDEAADELEAAGPAIFAEALAAHRRAQAEWPTTTDCDRLDEAFDQLNQRGIFARHHWWCCQTCGHGAMPAEHARADAAGRPARGYAFYHVQDTEAAADGHGLCLAFGAFVPGDEAAVAIAREVVEVLDAHGLRTAWAGVITQRISVDLTWQRRARPARWTEDDSDADPA